jgi:MFS transporter, putative metabolite:H+ symporter
VKEHVYISFNHSKVIASSSFIILADAGCKNNKTIQESYITFFGFNLWVPMTYAWSAENYPTRARATSIAPLIPTLLASLGATTESIVIFLIIDAFLVVAAIIAQFGTATQRKR